MLYCIFTWLYYTSVCETLFYCIVKLVSDWYPYSDDGAFYLDEKQDDANECRGPVMTSASKCHLFCKFDLEN
jgi:hypothetical protein